MDYESINSTNDYKSFLDWLYVKAKPEPAELKVPKLKILAVDGNQPPSSKQYESAIAVLYGIGYTLKMGLKHGKLPQPKGYFDYGVGGLESLWWSTKGEVNISDAKTLRWKAFLLLPAFIDAKLFNQARGQVSDKHSETDYSQAKLEELEEGHSVQAMHIGPYDKETPTINKILGYIEEKNFEVNGRHHEIYISDPRRTKPDKLKTVIRYPVKQT